MSNNQFETRPDHAQWGFLWYKEQEIFHATDADIAKIANDFKAAGITHVMTFSSTHFRWNFRSYFKEINRTIKRVVDACHAVGIYVVEHHSCNLFNGYKDRSDRVNAFVRAKPEDYPKLEADMSLECDVDGVKLKDLVQYSGLTGEPLWVDLYHAWAMCTNNPDYRKRYFNYLEDVYRQGVDGIMTDDVEFYALDSCACPHCRRLFRERYGKELPEAGDKAGWEAMLADQEGELFLTWKNFRYESSVNFHQAVVDHYTSLGLKMLRPNYIATSMSWANPWAYVFDDLPRLDWGFQECCCGAIRYSWPEYVLEAYHRSAVCHRYNVPVMSLYYPPTKNIQLFAWALSMYCGHKYLGTDHTNNIAAEGPLRAFEARHFELLNHLTVNGRVGIYDSARSRELDGKYSDETYKMICGVGQACIFNNIPFAIVSYRDWKEYNNYKVIIVPSARFMADSEIVQLGDFMRAGGTLIWCEECGMGDCITGAMRTREKVFKLLGGSGNGKLLVMSAEELGVPSYKRAFTYGTDIDGKPRRLPSDGAWQPFTDAENQRRDALADRIIAELGEADIETECAPDCTLVSSYYSKTGTLTTHLVNATDTLKEDEPGTGFGHNDPVPFKPNAQPIRVRVRKPDALKDFCYSKANLYTLHGDDTVDAVDDGAYVEYEIPQGGLTDYLLVELVK